MDGETLETAIDGEAEEEAEDANEQAEEEELVTVDAEKRNFGEVGKLEIGFAAGFVGFRERLGTADEQQPCGRDGLVQGATSL